jgi:hypothetical protein
VDLILTTGKESTYSCENFKNTIITAQFYCGAFIYIGEYVAACGCASGEKQAAPTEMQNPPFPLARK